jgi:hypothetical protein
MTTEKKPVQERKDVVLSISMTPDILMALDTLCEIQGVKRSAMLRILIIEEIAKNGASVLAEMVKKHKAPKKKYVPSEEFVNEVDAKSRLALVETMMADLCPQDESDEEEC